MFLDGGLFNSVFVACLVCCRFFSFHMCRSSTIRLMCTVFPCVPCMRMSLVETRECVGRCLCVYLQSCASKHVFMQNITFRTHFSFLVFFRPGRAFVLVSFSSNLREANQPVPEELEKLDRR